MSALGAKVKFDHGGVTLSGRLRGAVIYLDMPSVGATENLLMAATLASERDAHRKRGQGTGNRAIWRRF